MKQEHAELLGLTAVSRAAARAKDPRSRIPRGRAAAAAQAAWDMP